MDVKKELENRRNYMKSGFDSIDEIESDQRKRVPFPAVEKTCSEEQESISLPEVSRDVIKKRDIFDVINDRMSRRAYKETSLSLEELSYLLWATQGVRKTIKEGKITFRTVPSGGARHPFETYLAIQNVEGLKNGLYRYQPLSHSICLCEERNEMTEDLIALGQGQKFVGECAVTFIWSVIPYRTEWRYTIESAKIILQDSGHLCQNLYLAAESIDCGTVGIGAYNQTLADKFLGVDGHDEFVVYLAPVGKLV